MKRLLSIGLGLALLCGCPDDSSSSASYEGLDLSGDFVEMKSAGQTVLLGTNDSTALSKERPSMPVQFSENYFLGRHEVTCGDFNNVMESVSGLQLACENENLPATNVTFYDAVLYANAGSKAKNMDTVYSYRQAIFDEQNNCVSLEGFAFHPEKNGFRLPTEAEWVFAAQQNWNPAGEWLAENSGNVPHVVCSYIPANGICDMMGNVKEWVNDWMSPFTDFAVVDYAGSSDGGALGERVLKGGCYLKDAASVTLFGRGDVYTVTSATKTDYVGFRLAYGTIRNAVWVNRNGSFETSPSVPLVNSSTMRTLMGSTKVKLAFRNDNTGNLAYIDYSQAVPAIMEIQDTLDVYHPEISPDGNWVAFCTGLEGVSGKSALYVRKLDAEGSAPVKLDVESAAIPRFRVFGGDTVILYVTDAGTNMNESEFLGRSTWMVPFSAGAFGTPVQLFDGAYHGGLSEDLTLAVSGSSLLRAKKNIPGTTLLESSVDVVWYGGEQACNVSLAKDGTNRTAFLDFGGTAGHEFVGENYKAHEYLLIADANGNLVGSVKAPSGFTFDHTEWVSGFVKRKGDMFGKFVVATLTNVNGAHSKIALVNVFDGSVVELVEGAELWHPSVWVRSSVSDIENVQIDFDSVGIYYVDGGTDRSQILRYRMETFWKYKDSAELIGLGSSRTSNGFDPFYLKSARNSINLAYFYSNFYDIYEFYSRYVHKNAKNLKYVLISLDIDFWYTVTDDNFFYSEYKNYPGFAYDENHNYWRNSDYTLIGEAATETPEIGHYRNVFGNNRSSLYADRRGWGGNEPDLEHDSCWMDYYSMAYELTVNRFFEFLKMTSEDSVIVVGAIFPQSPEYRNTGSYGRYGLRHGEASVIIQTLHDLQSIYPNFVLMDEYKMGNHDYVDEMAQDCDHLAPLGAKLFTERLDSLIQTIPPLR